MKNTKLGSVQIYYSTYNKAAGLEKNEKFQIDQLHQTSIQILNLYWSLVQLITVTILLLYSFTAIRRMWFQTEAVTTADIPPVRCQITIECFPFPLLMMLLLSMQIAPPPYILFSPDPTPAAVKVSLIGATRPITGTVLVEWRHLQRRSRRHAQHSYLAQAYNQISYSGRQRGSWAALLVTARRRQQRQCRLISQGLPTYDEQRRRRLAVARPTTAGCWGLLARAVIVGEGLSAAMLRLLFTARRRQQRRCRLMGFELPSIRCCVGELTSLC